MENDYDNLNIVDPISWRLNISCDIAKPSSARLSDDIIMSHAKNSPSRDCRYY